MRKYVSGLSVPEYDRTSHVEGSSVDSDYTMAGCYNEREIACLRVNGLRLEVRAHNLFKTIRAS